MKKSIYSRLICVLVVLAMVVGMSACGKKAGDEATPEPAVVTPEPVDDSTPTPTPEIVLDLEGRAIRRATWWDETDPERGVSEAGDANADKLDEMKAKYNFTFEYINNDWTANHNLISSSVLSGDPFSDLVYMENKFFYPGFATKNVLLNVDQFEYFDFSEPKWNALLNDAATYKGQRYSVATGIPGGNSTFLFTNTTLTGKFGYEKSDIREMFDNHQWTWDKWLQLLKLGNQDLDNDGKIDIHAFTAYRAEVSIIYSNAAELATFTDNGRMELSIDTPNVIEALNFISDLTQVHKLWSTLEGHTKFIAGTTTFYAGPTWQLGSIADMEDDFTTVLIPMGPQASEYVWVQNEANMKVMLNGIPEPEEVAFIWNIWTDPIEKYMGLPENALEDWTGWEKYSRDDETLQFYIDTVRDNMYDSRQNTIFLAGVVNDKFNNTIIAGIKAKKTVSEAIEGNLDSIQQILNDAYAAAEAEGGL